MKGKYKAIIALLLVLVILPLSLFLSLPAWLPSLLGYWLPPGSAVTINSGVKLERWSISVPEAHYWVGDCEAAGVKNARLSHHGRWQLDINALQVNPHCLSLLSAGDAPQQEPLTLGALQQSLPDSRVRINNLLVTPWPQYQGRLTLSLTPGRQELQYDSHLFSTHLVLDKQLLEVRALNIHPGEDFPPLELAGKITMAINPDGIPPVGALNTRFVSSKIPVPLDVHLNWQKNSGLLSVLTSDKQAQLLTIPWLVEGDRLTIHDGQWQWPYMGVPLQGGLALQLEDWRQGLEKMTLSGRMHMVSQGMAGKGNVVLTIGPGKLSLSDSALPLRLTGEIKREQLILYVLLQGQLSGSMIDPLFTFSPGSLLVSRGQVNEALNIDDVRWPLAGVRISRQGIDGRLQAILRARQNVLGEMTLHLDGKAEQFIPNENQGQWRWRYWGRGLFAPVQAKWDVQGEGEWRDKRILFSSLSTGFDKLEYGSMLVRTPRLRLVKPLVWQQGEQHPQLAGAFVLETGRTLFGKSGGELPPATLHFTLDGRTPADFQFRGELQAQAIGPVRVSGRWDAEHLRGEAWWPKQSLTVFQPLLPPDWKMEMKGGDLFAQVAFSATQGQGFVAGGHGVVKGGALWLPDNQIEGVDFILPFRYQDARWHLGVRGPVSLRISVIRNQFTAQNVTADLQGWYPWDEQNPLWMSNVSADILGGKVVMQQLTMPQKHAALIRLQALSSSELVHAIKLKQFAFSGRISGGLPLWLNHPQWIVKDGWITSPGTLTFRMDKDMADAIADKNIAAGAAITWIRYLEITRSWARVSLDNLGEMEMQATVTGVSRHNGKSSSVNLNYHHQENIFSLWRSLRFGENLQNWLEENAALPSVPGKENGHVGEEKQ